MKNHAVLTGDIIGSSNPGPEGLDAAMGLLRRMAAEFGETHAEPVVGTPNLFRGDSWQLCLQRPALAVTAAVFLRAGFKAHDFDSQVGMGRGAVERLNAERISESVGPAFARSGRTLDELGKDQSLGLARGGETSASDEDSAALAEPDVAVGLLDAHVARWTSRESTAVYGSPRGLQQEAMAALSEAQTKEGNAPTRQAIQDVRCAGFRGRATYCRF